MALLKKLFPLFLDNFSVFLNQSPDNQHLMLLKTSVVNFPHLGYNIEFGFMSVFYDMNMNRLMII